MCTVFWCSQSNCPWHSFVCSVARNDSHFPLMLSCWCSMHCVRSVFFDSPIYFPLHEQSNWYTPVWLFGSGFGLFFWQRICWRFFPDVKAISFPIFLNSCFIFGLMFGIQVTSLDFYSLDFQYYFRGCSYYSFYCCILLLSFPKAAYYGHSQRTYRLKIFLFIWYISKNISSVLYEGNLWIHFWWC